MRSKPPLCSLTLVVCFAVWLACAFPLGNSVCAQSGCSNPPSNGQWWAPNTQITVWIDPSFGQQAYFNERNKIASAVTAWSGQPALASNNITLVVANPSTPDPGPNAPNVVRVLDNPSGSPNNLAYYTTTVGLDQNGQSTGQMISGTISFNRGFMLDPSTPAYDPNDFGSTSFFEEIFEHELGHEIGGLDDMPAPNNDPCQQTPGASIMNGYCGTNDSVGILPDSITPCDNNEVNQIQSCHQPVGGCPSGYYWDDFLCACVAPAPPEPAPCEYFVPFPFCYNWDSDNCLCLDEGSPIVLRVDAGSAYRLTSRTEGVWFDLDADGIRDRIAWTRYGDAVAFLALDLNGNGLIDNGAELFGNFTVLPSGQPAPNGFEALAIYDAPGHGGNGDGRIDSGDFVWAYLLLWIDWNHDGASQQNELYRPQDFSLWEVSLDAQRVGRRDAFGNFFRLKAPYRIGSQVKFAYDVYFAAMLSSRQ